jgi:hypothetical protein
VIPRARWQQIQTVFEQLADVGGAERDARLQRVCGADSELRESVQSLLVLDSNRNDPILEAVGAAAESLLAGRSVSGCFDSRARRHEHCVSR